MRLGMTVGALLALVLASLSTSSVAQTRATPAMTGFRSDAELRAFLRRITALQEEESGMPTPPPPPPVPAPPPPPPPNAAVPLAVVYSQAPQIVVTGSRVSDDAITNTQVAGVDEGGIVKLAGERLVVLRRGRLFTVSLAGGRMRTIDAVSAYPPGVDGRGDWYDEMLIAGDRVVVIGYSYARGGTEVNRFRLLPDGRLRFEDSTQLRSNDYYSSSNYASRLIGSRLVYYTPLNLRAGGRDPLDALPAIRRWQPDGRGGAWQRVVTPQRVFVPQRLRARPTDVDTVHSVVSCELLAPVPTCQATAVLGQSSRTFFVSTNAVYVWTSGYARRGTGPAPAMLYRLPLDLAVRPQAVGVRGAPIDQFSFSADPARSALNILVQSEGGGDAMWSPEYPAGSLALLRLPTRAFGSGATDVPRSAYQPLPPIEGYSVQNRFVGDHLLLGGRTARAVTVVGVGDRRVTQVALPHAVSRLDQMGADAIVVGPGTRALGFSTIVLPGTPRRADTFLLPDSAEGETRSQAFFFRPDTADGTSGLLGLPVAKARSSGTRFLGNAAAIQFLSRADRRLADAGELASTGVEGNPRDDGCVASCVDWYGNARPIFWRGRVFALMGYELVEGSERGGARGRRVREVARLDFAPRQGQKPGDDR